jgi:hypothetical protein
MPGPGAPHKEPPPPPRHAIEVDDEDIIDVTIGADEERAHSTKRRRRHQPPAQPGVPDHVQPASPDAPVTVAPEQNAVEDEEELRKAGRMDGGGTVEKELSIADTARHRIEGDVEGGGERSDGSYDESTVNIRKPRR